MARQYADGGKNRHKQRKNRRKTDLNIDYKLRLKTKGK